MTQQHPITPPPELVQQWWDGTHGALYEFEAVTTQAARWGADQELEACCEWLAEETPEPYINALRTSRRSKAPSLKEQALLAIDTAVADYRIAADVADVVRRALEQLPDNN
jgi:hypothetical protein